MSDIETYRFVVRVDVGEAIGGGDGRSPTTVEVEAALEAGLENKLLAEVLVEVEEVLA